LGQTARREAADDGRGRGHGRGLERAPSGSAQSFLMVLSWEIRMLKIMAIAACALSISLAGFEANAWGKGHKASHGTYANGSGSSHKGGLYVSRDGGWAGTYPSKQKK
jgi:hypothetical protein